jgi:HEAT repeat protein
MMGYPFVKREARPSVVMSPPEERKPINLEVLLQQILSAQEPVTVRLEAATQLAEHTDPQAVHALLSIINHETEPRLLMHVVSLLARKRIYSAVMPLIDLVLCTGRSGIEKEQPNFAQSDIGIRIRIAAVQALGRMGDERAIVPLMSVLGNQKENYRLRLSAAESLGRLGDAQALNPLINIMQDEQEPSQYLKESAVKALGMLGDIRALDPLLEMFESKKGIKNKFNFLKEQIIEAIGRLGSNENRAQSALLDALEDEAVTIRLSAVESLGEIGDETCIPALKKCLFDADDDVAISTVATLFQLGGEPLIREILEQQDNLPHFVRQELESYVP